MKITGKTRVIGIFGHPVEHSFSPAMHNAAFKEMGLEYCYVPFSVTPAQLPEAVKAVRALDLKGVNVTIPHKEAVLPLLDEVNENARLIGAVNTIVNRKGQLVGYNTDGLGFCRSVIEQGFSLAGQKVLLLGYGGAARAVAVTLAQQGVKFIDFACREVNSKVQQLSTLVNNLTLDKGTILTYSDLKYPTQTYNLVINSTPVGMYPNIDELPLLNKEFFNGSEFVCDLIYNPSKTRFLQEAEAKGCKILSGSGMLLYQGVEAFELWIGKKPPIETMAKILQEYYVRN